MTTPGPGPEAHRVAVKRGVTNTGVGIGDQGGLVTPNYGALIGLGASWRAQLIEKQKKMCGVTRAKPQLTTAWEKRGRRLRASSPGHHGRPVLRRACVALATGIRSSLGSAERSSPFSYGA